MYYKYGTTGLLDYLQVREKNVRENEDGKCESVV